MSQEVVIVFTAKSVERIIREGGTSSWRLKPSHARRCAFAVCTRNANADWVEGPEEHQSAFLIGKIREVVPCSPTPENDEAPKNRYLIQFGEFAHVNIPNCWEGDRNPIVYRSLNDLGVDPATLKWEVMPELPQTITQAEVAIPTQRLDSEPLTIAEAKKGLARAFNVTPEAIEITIRG
jgi:hypothetical protein